MDLTGPERLGLLMLCDIYDATAKDGEFDTKFIRSAIYGGHFWALTNELSGVFEPKARSEETVREVSDILDMWRAIETDYARLSAEDKDRVKASAGGFGQAPAFRGFDGNDGAGHYGIASFMVEELGWYDELKGRSLNSHGSAPTEGQLRMLTVYKPMREGRWHGPLSADAIIAVLAEQVHPSMR